MSNPIPIRTMPIFAINFHDYLALKLKNEFVLNNSITFWISYLDHTKGVYFFISPIIV